MTKLLLAIMVLFNILVCYNYFVDGRGTLFSFVMWQVVITFVCSAIIFYRARLKEIKPN